MGRERVTIISGAKVLCSGTDAPQSMQIVIENGRIADLVAPGAVVEDAIVIRADEMLVMPGLVNAHSHGQLTLCKGCNDRLNLELLLNRLPSLSAHRTREYHYLAAQIGAAEMLSKGCTAVYDLFGEFPAPTLDGVHAVASAYSDIGMRAVVAPMMADKTFYQAIPGLIEAFPTHIRAEINRIRFADYQESIERCRQILATWQYDRSRIRPALAPTIPHHCTDEFLVACRNLANEFDVGIQMHIAESRMQAVVAPMVHGATAVAHLDRLGLIGPRFTAAHTVWLDNSDISILGDRGASVAHNPGSNLRLGSGIAAVRRLLDFGINVAIGTDGAITSDNLNMFEAMRLAAFVSRADNLDADRWLTASESFFAGTSAGARALGFGDSIGRIAAGCRADLVFLDLSRPGLVPLGDAINQAIYAEDGTSVVTVMVDGETIYEGGRFLKIDYPALVGRVRLAAEEIVERTRSMRHLADQLEPIVQQFCAGLARRPLPDGHVCSYHALDR